jgi:hypothetical protein
MTGPATSRVRRDSEKEEPKEPPLSSYALGFKLEPSSGLPGYVKIVGGALLLSRIESYIKEPFYHYNSLISPYGYYLKPIHKVYKRKEDRTLIYVYYGRYWFRRDERGKLIYAGTEKPEPIEVSPPKNPLEGLSLIIDGKDLLVSQQGFDTFVRIASEYLHASGYRE